MLLLRQRISDVLVDQSLTVCRVDLVLIPYDSVWHDCPSIKLFTEFDMVKIRLADTNPEHVNRPGAFALSMHSQAGSPLCSRS